MDPASQVGAEFRLPGRFQCGGSGPGGTLSAVAELEPSEAGRLLRVRSAPWCTYAHVCMYATYLLRPGPHRICPHLASVQ